MQEKCVDCSYWHPKRKDWSGTGECFNLTIPDDPHAKLTASKKFRSWADECLAEGAFVERGPDTPLTTVSGEAV